ncbi:MAG: histidine phosphatase family protein [Rhizobiaceae bacterium]
MPALLLLRHAKSSWDDPALGDFDRPLAPRGLNAAMRMGTEIANRGWVPDLALVSTAVRARQTWDLAKSRFGPAGETIETRFDRKLYLASPATMLALLAGAAAGAETVMIVAHNPGTEMLAMKLAAPDSNLDALALMSQKYPTAALARLEPAGGWTDMSDHSARLTHFLRPRDLD